METGAHPISEAATEIKDSTPGLAHLGKTALPIIGRVGTVVGGVFSLLAVFKTISGEIVTTLEGFLLVSAVIASGIVAFHQSTVSVGAEKKQIYSYPRNARAAAATIMIIASILSLFFGYRLWINLNYPNRLPGATIRQTPGAILTRVVGIGKPAQTPVPPSATATATPTIPPPTRTLTVTPFPVDQMSDVNLLNTLGREALAAKKYSQAINYYSRATQIEAINAPSQFGLGQAYLFSNNFNAALEPFQVSLRLDSSLHDAHAYLGWIYDYRGDRAKAIAEYDVFLKVAPRDDPLRQDISERLKTLSGKGPIPSLTPYTTLTPTPNSTAAAPTHPPATNTTTATPTPK